VLLAFLMAGVFNVTFFVLDVSTYVFTLKLKRMNDKLSRKQRKTLISNVNARKKSGADLCNENAAVKHFFSFVECLFLFAQTNTKNWRTSMEVYQLAQAAHPIA